MPLILVSGDDRLRDDLKIMPWLEFVVSKKATSASTVELRNVDSVHAEMRVKAARAVRNISKAKTLKIAAPMKAGLHAVPPASLESLKGVPGLSYADNTITFTAPDFRAAYNGVIGLVTAARPGYERARRNCAKAPGRREDDGRIFGRAVHAVDGLRVGPVAATCPIGKSAQVEPWGPVGTHRPSPNGRDYICHPERNVVIPSELFVIPRVFIPSSEGSTLRVENFTRTTRIPRLTLGMTTAALGMTTARSG